MAMETRLSSSTMRTSCFSNTFIRFSEWASFRCLYHLLEVLARANAHFLVAVPNTVWLFFRITIERDRLAYQTEVRWPDKKGTTNLRPYAVRRLAARHLEASLRSLLAYG